LLCNDDAHFKIGGMKVEDSLFTSFKQNMGQHGKGCATFYGSKCEVKSSNEFFNRQANLHEISPD